MHHTPLNLDLLVNAGGQVLVLLLQQLHVQFLDGHGVAVFGQVEVLPKVDLALGGNLGAVGDLGAVGNFKGGGKFIRELGNLMGIGKIFKEN